MFSCEFCEISKNIFFHRTPVAASVSWTFDLLPSEMKCLPLAFSCDVAPILMRLLAQSCLTLASAKIHFSTTLRPNWFALIPLVSVESVSWSYLVTGFPCWLYWFCRSFCGYLWCMNWLFGLPFLLKRGLPANLNILRDDTSQIYEFALCWWLCIMFV